MTTTEPKQKKADHINPAGGSFIEKIDIAMGGEGGGGWRGKRPTYLSQSFNGLVSELKN